MTTVPLLLPEVVGGVEHRERVSVEALVREIKMSKKRIGICISAILLACTVYGQPLDGTPIELGGVLPQLTAAGFVPINQEVPLLLGQDPGNDDREPQTCVLADGTVAVFWVNRGGSHHVAGMKPDGTRIFPVFGAGAADVIVGINTGGNTNWTICEPSRDRTRFIAAATWQFGSLVGTDAQLPSTVGDGELDGIRTDDGQGHGFFKIFDTNLNAVTTSPVSVGQISLGHREWGAAGLSDGKWAIGVMSRDHRWAFDPDAEAGSRTPFLNIFNADGSRFRDEFAPIVNAGEGELIEDLTGSQSGRFQIAPMADSFALIIRSRTDSAGVTSVPKFIIYDNDGNVINSYSTVDTELFEGVQVGEWIAGAGSGTFVALFTTSGTQAMADLGMPADLIGSPVLLARRFDNAGPVGPYILVTTASDIDVGGIGRPRIAMAPNGSFALSWEDQYSDDITASKSMAFRVFNADGTPASVGALAHDLPEVLPSGGGDDGEPMLGMSDGFISLAWASRAFGSGNRDVAVNVVANPAQGSDVGAWEIY